ncbi:hypothetical protein MBLNU459_g3726t1 [Dothideomycetes sp. NU459]
MPDVREVGAADGQIAADGFDVEIIPGTEIMRDVDGVHQAHARGSRGSVLVPRPSSLRSDPLNWSPTWKIIVAVSQLIYVWVGVTSALSLAPVFPLLGAELHLGEQQLSLLTGLNVITLGFANIFIVPISNIFGRRMTSISFGVLLILTCVWEALATSHRSLLAARACNGIAAATSESIMVQIIADIFFLHERGTWMGIYFTMYFMGAFLGPIAYGNIAAIHGWRSAFWLSTALSIFATLLLVVGLPETKYHRSPGASPTLTARADNVDDTPPMSDDVVKGADVSIPGASSDSSSSFLVGQGRPNRSQFAAFQRADKRWKQFIVRDIFTPVRVFFNPIVFWAGLMLAGPADVLLIFNLTESSLLGAPPYDWNPGQVGYSNFAFAVGGLIGVATAGPLSDWIAGRATRRNNGIREAEMRLPALLPYVAVTVITHVCGGIGIQRHWPWQAVLVLGYGLSGLSVTSVPTIAIAYAIDCFKPISGEIMVVATVLKNVLGFCLSYWVFDVAATAPGGFVAVYMVQFAVTMLPVAATLPLYLWGKSLRRWYRHSDLHRMEQMI